MVKPYIHWDPSANATLHVMPGEGPFIVDSAVNPQLFPLVVSKSESLEMYDDPRVDYIQGMKIVSGTPPKDGLRVSQYQYMPDGMTTGVGPGEPLPLDLLAVLPPPWSSSPLYTTLGWRMQLRGYIGSAKNTGFAADVKVKWADRDMRNISDTRGGFTGLNVRSCWNQPGFFTAFTNGFGLVHGKTPATANWYRTAYYYSAGSGTYGTNTIDNGIDNGFYRIILSGGASSLIRVQYWSGGGWVETDVFAQDLTALIPPIDDWREMVMIRADLFAGQNMVQPPTPPSWPDAETWFSLIETTQFEPFVIDVANWSYRDWIRHWDWLVDGSYRDYAIERQLPVKDLIHNTPGLRGAPSNLRVSDVDLGICVEFNDLTFLRSEAQYDQYGINNTGYVSPVPMDDTEYGHQVPFAMAGRFKFKDMEGWNQSYPIDILAAGAPWSTSPTTVYGIGIYWEFTGPEVGQGKLVLRARDVVAAVWVDIEVQFDAEDWDEQPVELAWAWSGARGWTIGRENYELRLLVNGATRGTVINQNFRIKGANDIQIGSMVGMSSTPNRRCFSGLFREAMVFVDAMTDQDFRTAWGDTAGFDNPSFEIASSDGRPGEAESWFWQSFQAIRGWAGFNEYHARLVQWATAFEEFAAGFHFPHAWIFANEAERLAAIDLTWQAIAAAEQNSWWAIAYGNEVFVALSYDGTNRVMRSTDLGLSWSPIADTESNGWAGIAYGNGVFVGVAYGGTNRVMRSTDFGLSWSPVAAAEANLWRSVAYGAGVFVAVSSSGTNQVMRSTDLGLTWQAVAAAEANSWADVTYGNGVFIAVANDGTNRVMRSTDLGQSWSPVAAAEANIWRSVTYGNSVFVAVASSGTNRVMRSTDLGLSWSPIVAAEQNSWRGIAYGNGVFVAVATTGTNRIMQSTDLGQSWLPVAATEQNSWQDVTYGGGVFVAITYNGTNRVMRSGFGFFTADDVGKMAWQQSDDTKWILDNYSPIEWSEADVGTNEDWINDFVQILYALFNDGIPLYETTLEIFAIWNFSPFAPPGLTIGPPWLDAYTLIEPYEDTLDAATGGTVPLDLPTGFRGWSDYITGLMAYPLQVDEFGEAWDTDPLSTAIGPLWHSGMGVNGRIQGAALTFPLDIVPDRRFLYIYLGYGEIIELELTTGTYADAAALAAMIENLWVAIVGAYTGCTFDAGENNISFGWDGVTSPSLTAVMSMFGRRVFSKNNDARIDIGFDELGPGGVDSRIVVPAAEVLTLPGGIEVDEDFWFDGWSTLLFDLQADPYSSTLFAREYDQVFAIFGAFDGAPDPTVYERYTLEGWIGAGAVWNPGPPPAGGAAYTDAMFDLGTVDMEEFEDVNWPDYPYP
jgi:uncharacterized membrane protein YfbV (UPF0208 family)